MFLLNLIAYSTNLVGICLVLVGSWKMIFSAKPAVSILSWNLFQLKDEAKVVNIFKWVFGKIKLVDRSFCSSSSFQSVTVPDILETALKYLLCGIVFQMLAACLFLTAFLISKF